MTEISAESEIVSTTSPKQRRRVARTSLIGTAIEWYDFTIYGMTAAIVFGPQFFPQVSPLAGTLASFATFGIGFIARPVGGIVMGHYGDRIGRKAMLVTSLLMMGAATFLIGVLPTYASIGIAAPILLVLLRFVQGIGIGGEWSGAVLMGVEHAPTGARTYYGSFAQMGNPLGIAGAALTFLALTSWLTPEQFIAWGWRIPFLLSAALVVVGLWMRLKIAETPAFVAMQSKNEIRRVPIRALVRTQSRPLVLAGLASVTSPALGILMFAYLVTYAREELGILPPTILRAMICSCLVWLPLVLLTARLADRIGRRPVFATGLIFTMVWAWPFFALVDTAEPVNLYLAYAIAAIGIGFMTGPQAGLLADMFTADVRYSGASLAYQIGSVLGGGFAPIVATLIIARTANSTYLATYVAALALVSLAALIAIVEPRVARGGRVTAPAPSSSTTDARQA